MFTCKLAAISLENHKMKNALLTLAIVLAGLQTYAQQSIFPIDGSNVGIGTTSPVAKLDVQGGSINIGNNNDVTRALSVTTSTNANAVILIGNRLMNTEFVTNFSGSTDAYGVPTNTIGFGNAFNYPMVFTTNAIERFRIGENGNVSVGTTNLQAKFNVYQSAGLGVNARNSTLLTTFSGLSGSTNNFQNNIWLVRNTPGDNWISTRLHDGISIDVSFLTPQVNTRTWWERDPEQNIQSWGDQNNTYLTINGGNVGIGTTTPDQKLAVNGTIHSRQVIVDLNSWPDYVFKPDYKLLPLSQVKNYIDQYQHLPDVPSEQELLKNGLNLGEINKILTKKIEEITLYLIEKDKKDKEKESQLQSQQEQINQFKQQLDVLTKAISKK